MSDEVQILWFLFPVVLTVLAFIAWGTWVWFGIARLRKERAADEARAEHDRLERSVLDAQVVYLREIRGLTGFGGPTQADPAAAPSPAQAL